MSDKAIYSVDTITSTKDDDKIYVNTGDNIKQVKKSDLLSELNSNLSFKYNILSNDDISNTSYVDSLSGIVLYNSNITIVNVTVHMIKTITTSVWITQNNKKLPQPLSDCMRVKFYADGNAWFFIQNKGVVIGNAEGEKTYSATLIYKNA